MIMKMRETIPNKVELKVNTADSKQVEHDLACFRSSDDWEWAKNYLGMVSLVFFFCFVFFSPRVPSGLDAHDLSHSTPSERLEKAQYDRPGERSPEQDCC